ncbi:hypothetical protein KPC83_01215 [Collinsella sp. zg1085]|uniref:hypothetical protein n=1 Tax=Collinsella sp. zg1085 TaxID=2844380 RepID=UPI001C0D01C6|nr:hypothetical protein [Collinsella sp. zg1085]QWT17808.1 hypothetical protein KPC83_01215 [Collinsella sp. zg1085]
MSITQTERTQALFEQARAQIRSLEARGVWIEGNGFSPLLLVKGEFTAGNTCHTSLLETREDAALRAALTRLGWAPEDFCVLGTRTLSREKTDECSDLNQDTTLDAGAYASSSAPHTSDTALSYTHQLGTTLAPEVFCEAIEALDPEAILLLDVPATELMREAYMDVLVDIENFETAMLEPGYVASVLGRRVLALGDFAASLADSAKKQLVWSYLKKLAPLGSPY